MNRFHYRLGLFTLVMATPLTTYALTHNYAASGVAAVFAALGGLFLAD